MRPFSSRLRRMLDVIDSDELARDWIAESASERSDWKEPVSKDALTGCVR